MIMCDGKQNCHDHIFLNFQTKTACFTIISLPLFIPAVREDRMPGGRNSGAVYNLYKVSTDFI